MIRKSWYQNVDVQFELIHQTKHRETFFLPFDKLKNSTPPIRWMNASAIKFLKMHWDRYKFLDKDMNIYSSLATYKNFPTFSYSWRVKSEQQRVWMKEFHKYINGYDLFVETDSKDIEKSHADTLKIKNFLDDYNIKYSLKFSGSKGFHYIVQYSEFEFLGLKIYDEEIEKKAGNFKFWMKNFPMSLSQLKKFSDLVLLFKLIAWRLHTILGCETIDTSVQDVKRVIKLAYSWDVKSGLIALPLTDEQLTNFRKDICRPENVLKAGVHKRGLLWRNTSVDKEQRENKTLTFLQDLGILA